MVNPFRTMENMTSINLVSKAEAYLNRLCLEIPTRRVGSPGNWAATEFFAEIVASFGFQTERPEFDCLDWKQEGAHLSVDGQAFPALVSPFSLSCHTKE